MPAAVFDAFALRIFDELELLPVHLAPCIQDFIRYFAESCLKPLIGTGLNSLPVPLKRASDSTIQVLGRRAIIAVDIETSCVAGIAFPIQQEVCTFVIGCAS